MTNILPNFCKSKWNRLSLSVFTTLLIGLVLSGCSNDWLVSDTGSSTDDAVSFFEQPFSTDGLSKRTDVLTSQTRYSEMFLPKKDGGVIALGENSDVEAFVVLPYSYPADTTFTVQTTKLVTNTGETPVIYSFGPDGLQFSRPAVLRINAHELFGENTELVNFYWHNEATGEWEIQSSQKPADDGTVWFSVEHFSVYSAGSGSGATGVK